MKVQYCSDLHLEFQLNREFMKNNPLIPVGDILILVGDICCLNSIDDAKEFLECVSDNFNQTYWIAGNHEYYHYDLAKVPVPLNEKIMNNVTLLNNKVVKIDDVNFIFTTLWSKVSEQNRFIIQQSLNDFHVIKNKGKNLTVSDYNEMHKADLKFLMNAVNGTEGEKQVVITHHVPTLMNYPEQYKNTSINEAFAVELFDVISDNKINKWIYGHHHCNIPNFKIEETEILTNQLGYVRNNEHELFKLNAYFEI